MFGKRKQHHERLVGLDIGSTAIRIAVGQLIDDPPSAHQRLHVLGVVETPSSGVQRGVVGSIEDTVSAISQAEEQAERLVGVPLDSAWIGIGGTHIVSQASRGVVAVAKPNGEIGPEDVDRVVEAARMVVTPLNYELIHVIPRSFIVDGQTGIKDPVGMSGIRLEVETQMIYGMTAHLKNITKAVYRTGIDIDDLVLSIFATGEVVSTSRQRDLGVGVVNIGGATTSLVVYEEGDIIHTAVLPLGSEHITNDLAIGLRTSIDIAERVKTMYGQCTAEGVNKRDSIDLSDAGAPGDVVMVSYMVDIIAARVAEILERVDKELRLVGKSGRLPAGIIFTGAGAKINGLVELGKEVLRLPCTLGYPVDIYSATDKAMDVSFTTAVGLLRWGAHVNDGRRKVNGARVAGSGRLLAQLQKVFQSLMP